MGCDPLPSLVDEYYTTSQRLLSIIFLENNSQCPKLMRTDGNQTSVLQKYDWFFSHSTLAGMRGVETNQKPTTGRDVCHDLGGNVQRS